jgi:hypothetical protein
MDLNIVAKVLAGHVITAVFMVITGILGIYYIHIKAAGMMSGETVRAAGLMIIVMAAGIIFAVTLGIRSSRSISKQMKKAADLAEEMTKRMQETAAAIEKIVSGDLNFQLKPQSDDDVLGTGVNSLADMLRELAKETDIFISAVLEGDLKIRADAEKFSGEYREIVNNFNRTIDAMTEPIKLSCECMEKIGKGIIPAKINRQGRNSRKDYGRVSG